MEPRPNKQQCRGRSPLPGRGGYQLNQEWRGRSPLPGFGVSPKNSFSLFCRRRRLISKTHKSILSKSTGLTRHNYLHKKPSKLAVRNTKSKAILTTVQRKL